MVHNIMPYVGSTEPSSAVNDLRNQIDVVQADAQQALAELARLDNDAAAATLLAMEADTSPLWWRGTLNAAVRRDIAPVWSTQGGLRRGPTRLGLGKAASEMVPDPNAGAVELQPGIVAVGGVAGRSFISLAGGVGRLVVAEGVRAAAGETIEVAFNARGYAPPGGDLVRKVAVYIRMGSTVGYRSINKWHQIGDGQVPTVLVREAFDYPEIDMSPVIGANVVFRNLETIAGNGLDVIRVVMRFKVQPGYAVTSADIAIGPNYDPITGTGCGLEVSETAVRVLPASASPISAAGELPFSGLVWSGVKPVPGGVGLVAMRPASSPAVDLLTLSDGAQTITLSYDEAVGLVLGDGATATGDLRSAWANDEAVALTLHCDGASAHLAVDGAHVATLSLPATFGALTDVTLATHGPEIVRAVLTRERYWTPSMEAVLVDEPADLDVIAGKVRGWFYAVKEA